MTLSKFKYCLIGLLLGIVVGLILCWGTLNGIKKSQRENVGNILYPISAIIFAIIGASKGYDIGRIIFIEERAGISNIDTNYLKDGRFWVAVSNWHDSRTGTEFSLITARSNRAHLVSTLNDRIIYKHSTNSASKEVIPKAHNNAIAFVRETVIRQFESGLLDVDAHFKVYT